MSGIGLQTLPVVEQYGTGFELGVGAAEASQYVPVGYAEAAEVTLNDAMIQIAYQSAAKLCMARVTSGGNYIKLADIAAIKYAVAEHADADRLTHSDNLVPLQVIFDQLQLDENLDVPNWTVDDIGYNFRFEVPAVAFPRDTAYEVEVMFTPTRNEAFPIVFRIPAAHRPMVVDDVQAVSRWSLAR